MKHKRTDKWNNRNPLTGFLSSLSANTYFFAVMKALIVTGEQRESTPFSFQTSDKTRVFPKRLPVCQKRVISVTENDPDRRIQKLRNRSTKRTIGEKVLFDFLRGAFLFEPCRLVSETGTAINRPGKNLTRRLTDAQQIRQL
jgi:hypothetical protein